MAESPKTSSLKKLSFTQLIALMLAASTVMGGVASLVYTGVLTPTQGEAIFSTWQDKISNFERDLQSINSTLQVSWNPVFYTASNALANYAIYNLTGASINYYAVQNMSVNGQLWFYQTNVTRVEENVLGNMSVGAVWMNALHNYSLSVPESVTVTESVGGLERKFVNAADSQGSPYTIGVDAVQSGYFNVQDSNGRIINAWSSTNRTAAVESLTNYASVGASVVASQGVYGSRVCKLIIGAASEAVATGQATYQSAIDAYSLADASSNATIGYGYIYLAVMDSAESANCLLMNDGVYTLAAWSWSDGLIWVDTAAGTLTQSYPSGTGDQLVSVGVMLNATTIQFTNPNGFYMEHS
ncbi:MAG: hypothetical protein WC365_06395 [Candidatus Babeliales bacterium]|jgi:hypothetical protein